MYERLCTVLDRTDLLEDERFETIDDRIDHRETLRDELIPELEAFTATELEGKLLEAGIPAGAVRTVDELLETDEHVEARSMLVDSYNPEVDETVTTAALPFRFSSGLHDGQFSSRPPKKGEHTDDILAALSYSTDEIARLHETGAVIASS